VTLNDPEGHFSYLTLFNSLYGNMTGRPINFNMCTRIGEHTWPVTLNELEGHLSVSELFKCKSFTFCAAPCTISTGTLASRGPSATAGLLFNCLGHCKDLMMMRMKLCSSNSSSSRRA